MNADKHINKALHNEDFWRYLNTEQSKYPDWAVVGVFYSAMHYIDAVFAKEGKHSKDHDSADTRIGNHKKLVSIHSEYRYLKQFRWKASYLATRFSKQEIDKDIVPQFERIRAFTLNILKD